MTRFAAPAVALVLAVSGCGDDDGEALQPTQNPTELTITLDRDGPGGEPIEDASLSCPEAGAPAPACEVVAELPEDPAAPTPADTACTEIFGGPDTVTVAGTLRGEPIDAELTRADGCEIERFDRFTPLLQELFGGYEPGAALAP